MNARKQLKQIVARVRSDATELLEAVGGMEREATFLEGIATTGTDKQVQDCVDILKKDCPELFGN